MGVTMDIEEARWCADEYYRDEIRGLLNEAIEAGAVGPLSAEAFERTAEQAMQIPGVQLLVERLAALLAKQLH